MDLERDFSLCIVSCEHYQTKPLKGLDELYSEFRASEIDSVPVIRIFGITGSGQKACLHVHGVFPYVSIPYDGELGLACESYMQELANSIDHALNFPGSRNRKQHVYNISLISKIPYYGYHDQERNFLRIYFFSSNTMKKVTDLMNAGSIMNTVFQPYDAHIPYILQFFIDYNLHGMNYIHAKHVRFRFSLHDGHLPPLTSPLHPLYKGSNPLFSPDDVKYRLWDIDTMASDMMLDEAVAKQSVCELEVDCNAKYIQNQFDPSAKTGNSPALAVFWEEERRRHKELLDESVATPSASQDRLNIEKSSSEKFFLQRLKEKLKDIILSSEENSNDSYFNCSQKSRAGSPFSELGQEDLEYLEMFAEMISAEDADSVLSTQKSNRSLFDPVESSDETDSNDSLEMSQIIWKNGHQEEEEQQQQQEEEQRDTCFSSSGSSIQPGQRCPINPVDCITHSEEKNDQVEAGCSFWLSQLDGQNDKNNQPSTSKDDAFAASRKKKALLKTRSERNSRRISQKLRSETFNEPRNLRSGRIATVKVEGHISPTKILDSLPTLAVDALFSNGVKISDSVSVDWLKKIGSEKIMIEPLPSVINSVPCRENIALKDEKSSKNNYFNISETRKPISGKREYEDEEPISSSIESADAKNSRKRKLNNSSETVPANIASTSSKVPVFERRRTRLSRKTMSAQSSIASLPSKSLITNINSENIIPSLGNQLEIDNSQIYFDAMYKLSYLSPPSPTDAATSSTVSTPLRASFSPTTLNLSSNSLQLNEENVSEPSQNSSPLRLESSDEIDVKTNTITNKKHPISIENELIIPSTGIIVQKLPDSGTSHISETPETNSISVNKNSVDGSSFVLINSEETPKLNSSIYSFVESEVDDVSAILDKTYEVSFANISRENSSDLLTIDEKLNCTIRNDSKEIDTIKNCVLEPSLKPPDRKTIELGYNDVTPLGSTKIDKQAFAENVRDLKEYQGMFYDSSVNKKLSSTSKFFKTSHEVLCPVLSPPSFTSVANWCRERKNQNATKINLSIIPPPPPVVENNESTPFNRGLSKTKMINKNSCLQRLSSSNALSPISLEKSFTKSKTTQSPLNRFSMSEEYATPKTKNDTFFVVEGASFEGCDKMPSIQEPIHREKETGDALTVMSLEVHCQTRCDLRPDPKLDEISAIFYCIDNQARSFPIIPKNSLCAIVVEKLSNETIKTKFVPMHGLFYLDDPQLQIAYVDSEKDLFSELVKSMRRWDPDIIAGYEIEMLSWGYILERATLINPEIWTALSRIPEFKQATNRNNNNKPNEQNIAALLEDIDSVPEIRLAGRIVLNVWKLLRKEVALTSYTFENTSYRILNWRIPLHTHRKLTEWFTDSRKLRWHLLEHYVVRVCGSLRLLDHFNLIGRTSELARLFGIQFYEVLSRGSQFRVESMMLRITKGLNFIPVSCSVQQRAHARAPECIPLILEPESKFYTDPVLVLDFQSLYPSIVIAYNYCYSTCMGRMEHLGKNEQFEFGCTLLGIPTRQQKLLEDDVTVSPTGIVFVKSSIRRGVLPRMLEEILKTRIMVKKSMKDFKDNKSVHKLLDARQLGLKLIANVTYGYTGANYSGRMPCVEVADSILGKARETLQRAINLVEKTSKWKARVVYGDTDSMFVCLPGRTKATAFRIGQEIADAVTALNPSPIKLKFEKVYLPCVLQTKKRYVGNMYETSDQLEPIFDAKGIETVRRDNCPIVGKILEQTLKLLFEHGNTGVVRQYVQRQFQKILSNRVSVQQFVFAKEYRGLTGYRAKAHVPALVIAKRNLQKDPRSDFRVGERVPYVIVYGPPGLPLISLLREPYELLLDPCLRLNVQYYVTRVIVPPLERVFNLMGINVKKWLSDLPRINSNVNSLLVNPTTLKGNLTQYFASTQCLVCEKSADSGLCFECKAQPQAAILSLSEKNACAETIVFHLQQLCCSCTGLTTIDVECVSIDCPVLFRLSLAKRDREKVEYYRQLMEMSSI